MSVNHELIAIGNNELITVVLKTGIVEKENEKKFIKYLSVWKYYTIHNKWRQITDFNKKYHSSKYSVTFDPDSELIYLCGQEGQLFEIDLEKEQITELCSNVKCTHGEPVLFVVKNHIHIISVSGCHQIFQKDTHKLETIGNITDYVLARMSPTIKRPKSMIIGGEYIDHENESKPGIVEYFWDKKQFEFWNIEGIEDPVDIIATKNKQYLILFSLYSFVGNIFLYNIRNKKLIKTDIKIPDDCLYLAIDSNKNRDDLLVFGYVQELFKSPEYQTIPLLPYYLIKLIGKWISFENIHLTGVQEDELITVHWKINIDKIFQSAMEE